MTCYSCSSGCDLSSDNLYLSWDNPERPKKVQVNAPRHIRSCQTKSFFLKRPWKESGLITFPWVYISLQVSILLAISIAGVQYVRKEFLLQKKNAHANHNRCISIYNKRRQQMNLKKRKR